MDWKDGELPEYSQDEPAEEEVVQEQEETIHINIWDDYCEDGYVPQGEIQETYIYVEENDMDMDFKKECLEKLLGYIKEHTKFEKTKFWIELYDSRKKYPNIKEEEHPHFHFQRWEIKVQHLTHKQKEKLVEQLENAKLEVNGIPFNIYSES